MFLSFNVDGHPLVRKSEWNKRFRVSRNSQWRLAPHDKVFGNRPDRDIQPERGERANFRYPGKSQTEHASGHDHEYATAG
jgi:hypothetical protein